MSILKLPLPTSTSKINHISSNLQVNKNIRPEEFYPTANFSQWSNTEVDKLVAEFWHVNAHIIRYDLFDDAPEIIQISNTLFNHIEAYMACYANVTKVVSHYLSKKTDKQVSTRLTEDMINVYKLDSSELFQCCRPLNDDTWKDIVHTMIHYMAIYKLKYFIITDYHSWGFCRLADDSPEEIALELFQDMGVQIRFQIHWMHANATNPSVREVVAAMAYFNESSTSDKLNKQLREHRLFIRRLARIRQDWCRLEYYDVMTSQISTASSASCRRILDNEAHNFFRSHGNNHQLLDFLNDDIVPEEIKKKNDTCRIVTLSGFKWPCFEKQNLSRNEVVRELLAYQRLSPMQGNGIPYFYCLATSDPYLHEEEEAYETIIDSEVAEGNADDTEYYSKKKCRKISLLTESLDSFVTLTEWLRNQHSPLDLIISTEELTGFVLAKIQSTLNQVHNLGVAHCNLATDHVLLEQNDLSIVLVGLSKAKVAQVALQDFEEGVLEDWKSYSAIEDKLKEALDQTGEPSEQKEEVEKIATSESSSPISGDVDWLDIEKTVAQLVC